MGREGPGKKVTGGPLVGMSDLLRLWYRRLVRRAVKAQALRSNSQGASPSTSTYQLQDRGPICASLSSLTCRI